MSLVIQEAKRERLKLRLGLYGPPGGGKTLSALLIAKHLVPGGRILMLDTENRSSLLYADDPQWDVQFDFIDARPPYTPSVIAEAVALAEANGYAVLIIDSLSHYWKGVGGTIDIAEKNQKGGNKWSGWAAASPEQDKMTDAILHAQIHLIACMRSDTEWVLKDEINAAGRIVQKPTAIGLKPTQHGDIGYEFTLTGLLDSDHILHIMKTRCWQLTGAQFPNPGQDFSRTVMDWLDRGIEPEPPEPTIHIFRIQMRALGLETDLQIKQVKDELGLGAYTPSVHYAHREAIVQYLAAKANAQPETAAPPTQEEPPEDPKQKRRKSPSEVDKMFERVREGE